MELISIIIPVYNAGSNLKKSLDSVINQTYSNLQIICIDDGSSDNSLELLKEYRNRDRRIEIISQINSGVSIARNSGLKIMKGDYVLFLDSDDWLELDTCEKAMAEMRATNSDVVMWPYIREMRDKSLPKKIFKENRKFEDKEVQEFIHRRMIGIVEDELRNPENADALCTVWGKLYKAKLIKDNNISFYDIREIGTYEDGLFNLNVFQYVNRAAYMTDYLYHYRRDNSDSITSRYNEKLRNQWKNLFHIMKEYIDNNQLGSIYQIALDNRIALSLIVLGINEVENKTSLNHKISKIREIIIDPSYRKAIKTLKIKYFPVHWKIFFLCAKYKNPIGIYILILIIQKMRGR